MKEVIFVLLNGFADWEGAFTAICLNQGVKPGNPINYKVNAARKSKVDDKTAKMQSIKWLGV